MSRRDVHVGWVPNVAGRLSFSHLGDSKFPTPCARENTGNIYGRRIVVVQQRPLSDWLLPDWYFRFLKGFSANWKFLLVAKTSSDPADQIARVEGEVLVFEAKDWANIFSGPSHDSTFCPEDIFNGELLSWAQQLRLSEAPDSLPENALDQLRSESLFSFKVGIRRSGVTWIQLISVASDITFADDYESDERKPNELDFSYIANQVFFFLKDISHAHRHHPPGSDTITESAPADHRRTWAIDAHYRIHRKIVEMRRSKDPKVLYNALGMLAYLSALGKAVTRPSDPFVSNSSTHRRRSAVTYNNSEIDTSLKAALEVMKWRQTQTNIIKTALPALLLSLISMIGFDDKSSLGYLIRNTINEFFASNPKQTIGMLLLLFLATPIYYGMIDLYALPPILRAKRVLAGKSLRKQTAFWFLGSIALMSIGVGELYLAQLMQIPWATWLRAHPRVSSWVVVSIGLGLAAASLYALPFWSTRRDLFERIKKLRMSVR